ncbi:MAG: cardiolipin synthase [Bacteroidetes bacterium RIFOXYA12_FULL_35_11]|nr:MAG: cardiolipin synthase [Bacteroidetes bacterium GWF2_35_48]OFY74526.1 MAG: cardiolipin synthase [Bacteroidetes bacterium RIFOXYA12_FULL_35_11]OFY94323.1 MAG: cardiolipin synthase [Bacteroidetes bacterium RIFOXYC12_FULL_35_7]OFY97685.1 MAG: cardiolipin synthase [Bacteroidetes bacterium RIFOXYB2_FULL_35_7]HBX49637.1 cardiolipin synthase [Bacteroidales bacterium]
MNIDWQYIQTVLLILYEVAIVITVLFVVFSLILEKRDPQKTITWIIFILLLPIVGIILYFIIGKNYRKEKIFSKKILTDFEQIERIKNAHLAVTKLMSGKTREVEKSFGIINLLHNNNKALLSEHNKVLVLNNGSETFNAILHDINNAKDHIHLEYYIIEEDEIGNKIHDLLIKKAKQGIEVRLIYDDIGSWNLSSAFIESLKEAGVEVFSFLPVKFYRLATKINYRNHRKIIIVDGRVGFVGGLNIADRYIHGSHEVGLWRDTHLRLEGDAVISLQYVFLMDWNFVSNNFVHDEKYFPETQVTDKCLVQIAASGPDSDWASIMQTYFYAISTAKKYVYISTPYFMPNESLLTALKTIALSGVDVRIILPSKSDSFISYWGSMSYVSDMLDAGVKIFIYEKGFTHSKVLIVDDLICSVGTANMDLRSFDQNFEVNALIYNKEIACTLKATFTDDLSSCLLILQEDYDKRPFAHKVKESFTRIFSPLW